jgi:hypothetical protein
MFYDNTLYSLLPNDSSPYYYDDYYKGTHERGGAPTSSSSSSHNIAITGMEPSTGGTGRVYLKLGSVPVYIFHQQSFEFQVFLLEYDGKLKCGDEMPLTARLYFEGDDGIKSGEPLGDHFFVSL